MAVVIRMKRAGAKKRPFFRVVVADSRSRRDGRFIEQLGYYDPLTDPATFRVNEERFTHWVRQGALPSNSVEVMMAKHAPSALRPAPLPKPPAAEPPAEAKPRAAKKKAPAKKKAAPAKKKAVAKTKGTEKKALARAKAKARKTTGASKPKAAKKAKKS